MPPAGAGGSSLQTKQTFSGRSEVTSESWPRPSIADAEACIRSEAAALSVSLPEEKSLLYYRKGYCTFAGALASRNPRQFQDATGEFDKAVEAWPLRVRKPSKLVKPEPVSPALRVFAA